MYCFWKKNIKIEKKKTEKFLNDFTLGIPTREVHCIFMEEYPSEEFRNKYYTNINTYADMPVWADSDQF